ncbi:tetratricopeptide repeat protein [Collinsella ihumii]|uniref:Tetratricopeptide repeat protein n=1 Tax=Collinsella ihumii TaxID=1720204 RepID=A0AAW7JW46_9ACTN|nr:tetratricopeptide repeat protein [Collinsella ihumii]MDN0068795.1 tetratricopeptide repeat protein [Collinsella ihumii]
MGITLKDRLDDVEYKGRRLIWLAIYVATVVAIGFFLHNNIGSIYKFGMSIGSIFCKSQYAKSLFDGEDYSDAYPLFAEVSDEGYDNALIYAGICKERLGEYAQAAELYEQAYQTDIYSNESDYYTLAYSIACCYFNSGDYINALSWADNSTKGNLSEGFNLAGWCHFQLGDTNSAIDSFTTAIDLGYTEGLYGLGCCHERNGDKILAADCYRQAAQAGSQSAKERLEELELTEGQ